MVEIIESAPVIQVEDAEYHRLLGYPRGHELSDRALELVEGARTWYGAYGRPWLYARQADSLAIQSTEVVIDSVPFASRRLRTLLERSRATGAFVAAVSAGPEVETEAQQLWEDGKPDEYFFLEMFGAGVVESLLARTAALLSVWADHQGLTMLHGLSPGYGGWDISEQCALLDLIGAHRLPGGMEVLESGALRPKKSMLAVYGVTCHKELAPVKELPPCVNCPLKCCQYRRADEEITLKEMVDR